VPQTPAARTLMSTSLGPQVGSGTSRSCIPGPGPVFTTARIGAREEGEGAGIYLWADARELRDGTRVALLSSLLDSTEAA
jgi:hypothetical protein